MSLSSSSPVIISLLNAPLGLGNFNFPPFFVIRVHRSSNWVIFLEKFNWVLDILIKVEKLIFFSIGVSNWVLVILIKGEIFC